MNEAEPFMRFQTKIRQNKNFIRNSSAFRLPCYEIRPFRVLPTAKGRIPCRIYILARTLQQVQSPGLNGYKNSYIFVRKSPLKIVYNE